MDNLEQIKKALEIEVKYKYININGKTRSFSSFICSELRKEIKKSNKLGRATMELCFCGEYDDVSWELKDIYKFKEVE